MIWSANNGIVPPMMFACRRAGKVLTEALPAKLGPMLSRGAFKDTIFGFWRRCCEDPAVDIFACASEQWGFRLSKSGEEFQGRDPEGYRKMTDHGFVKLSAAGYGEVSESFGVVVQTREQVHLRTRAFVREGEKVIWRGPADSWEMLQEHFKGRQKMWGDLRAENLS